MPLRVRVDVLRVPVRRVLHLTIVVGAVWGVVGLVGERPVGGPARRSGVRPRAEVVEGPPLRTTRAATRRRVSPAGDPPRARRRRKTPRRRVRHGCTYRYVLLPRGPENGVVVLPSRVLRRGPTVVEDLAVRPVLGRTV